MLDEALKNGDEEAAFEIVAKMETQQAEESLQDQQLILELVEQELELMDAMEQLETLESLQRLEDEEAELATFGKSRPKNCLATTCNALQFLYDTTGGAQACGCPASLCVFLGP